MRTERKREEVLNVHLAIILKEQGLVSAPESILRLPDGRKRYPDVLVEYRDLRVAIEGKIGDVSGASAECLKAANQRVEERIADAALSIIYPSELRNAPIERLRDTMDPPILQVATVRIGKISEFRGVTVSKLAELLRAVYEDILGEEVIEDAARAVEDAVISFEKYTEKFKTVMDRLTDALGMKEEPKNEKEREALRRIGGLVLLNAFVFQEVLSGAVKKAKPLRDFMTEELLLSALSDHWAEILKLNWYPIFHIAWKIVNTLPTDAGLSVILRMMITDAQKVVEKRVSLRHDLMGRVYHKLLVEKKFLATYFTSIPAAALLLRLALNKSPLCNSLESVSNARIADIACGTGTLLMAAASAIEENYIRSSVESDVKPDLLSLHKNLIEETLYGFDVLPSAVHLTASTLSLRAPDVNFYRTNLYVLPYGGKEKSLGSIEFLVSSAITAQKNLFSEPESEPVRIRSDKKETSESASLPKLDVCVMNPPFTKSGGGNLLFGSSPPDDRREMQKRLSGFLNRNNISASSTAGLGSVFVAVADRYLKENGVMALVLPMACLSGIAWAKTRQLWVSKYVPEWILTSHDPRHWNFSENTSLSEVLLVLRKLNSNATKNEHTKFVNLWQNPRMVSDAVTIARGLLEMEPPNLLSNQAGIPIRLNGDIFGEVLTVPWSWFKQQESWILPCAFGQSLLTKSAIYLQEGKVSIPGIGIAGAIPLVRLGRIASVGPDRRDVMDGFVTPRRKKELDSFSNETPFPFFWGHDSAAMVSLRQKPNVYLRPLGKARKGRHLRKTEQLWPLASRLLVTERLWLNTYRVSSVIMNKPVLSNVWWEVTLNKCKYDRELSEKLVCMWLNSSLGLLTILTCREQTRGAFVALKKPQLKELLVPDIDKISISALKKVASAFDAIADNQLQPFPNLEKDEVRIQIDGAICGAFGLPDLAPIRTLLANEPIVSLKPLYSNE
jgi:type I restriction-modification system DNA methylase subunit